jgi:ABC-type branched-subunit amino acid transport system substrate-binding protein
VSDQEVRLTDFMRVWNAGAVEPVPVPVFDGAAEVVKLLGKLYRRPRIGESPRWERGARGRRLRRGLPMLCLVRPAGSEVLAALACRLIHPAIGRIPHAMLTFTEGRPTGEQLGVDGAGQVEAVRSILFALAGELSRERNAKAGRLRFRRFGLVNWLLQQDIREFVPDQDRELLRLLRERSLARRRFPGVGDEVQSELRNNLPAPWWARPLVPLLRWFPPLWFAVKVSGRLPFFGRDYRWFLRQPFMAPHDPGTFVGFAERLTKGLRDQENTTQILMLLVNAFLEDLRRGYRRLPWRPRAARRTTYIVVLLDGVRRDNSGYRILKLINDVRNETGAFDPLLLISGSEKLPPEALDPDLQPARHPSYPARDAQLGYETWCNRLALASRARTPTAWYLPIRIPSVYLPPVEYGNNPDGGTGGDTGSTEQGIDAGADHTDSEYTGEVQRLDAIGPFTIGSAPVWARRAVLYPLVVALVVAMAGISYLEFNRRAAADRLWAEQHCSVPRDKPGANLLSSVTDPMKECIGISDGSYSFNDGDPKLNAVMNRIKEQNRSVADVLAADHSRRLITLVYFSALSPTNAPDGLVSQREALAGVAALQKQQNHTSSRLLLRVLVANGGVRMKHGTDVAGELAELAKRDPSIVGVVGLGQSRQPTKETINRLTAAGLPMIASALTADNIADSPLYYQVSPQNKREAAVAARYAAEKLLPERGITPRVRIVQSNDENDYYSSTLAEDALKSFQEKFRVESVVRYKPTSEPPDYKAIPGDAQPPGKVGRDTCGFDGLVFYAGRTEDFREFLEPVKLNCDVHERPTILAGDDVSRYVADPDKRKQLSVVEFDYMSLAVGQQSCDEFDSQANGQPGPSNTSELYDTLRELFPDDCKGGIDPSLPKGRIDPSLDGHAALAYDATQAMVKAVQDLISNGVQTITPAAVWHAISEIRGNNHLQGASGTIDFDPAFEDTINGHVPVDKAIAILRVSGADERKPDPKAYCGKAQGRSPEQWCPTSTKLFQ